MLSANLTPYPMKVLRYSKPLETFVLSTSHRWLGVVAWLAGFVFMLWMKWSLGLGLAAMTIALVLTSALASLFFTPFWSVVSCMVGWLVFSYYFANPIGEFAIAVRDHHELLLLSAVGVSVLVGNLTSRLRSVMQTLQDRLSHLKRMQLVSACLNQSLEPLREVPLVVAALEDVSKAQVCFAVGELYKPPGDEWPDVERGLMLWGTATDRQREALVRSFATAETLKSGNASIALPLLTSQRATGAVLLTWTDEEAMNNSDMDAVKSLCGFVSTALERAQQTRESERAKTDAYRQRLSNLVLSAVSHEYRTPLASIMSLASNLRELDDARDTDKRRSLIEDIEGEVKHLGRVTSNLLLLARLEVSGEPLSLEWESVEDLVGGVLHRHSQREPGWKIQSEVASELPLIRCDAVLLSQMLDNLLENARKYASGQAPRVSAWADEDRVWLAVDDQGPGVDERLQLRIFDAFFTDAGSGLERRPDVASVRTGVGVGLALCRSIMRAHGGDLQYLPRSGGGSRFLCSLKRFPMDAQTQEALKSEEQGIAD